MSRVLVTGGTGLCGREIIRELSGSGYEVVATTRRPAPRVDGAVRWVTCDLATLDEDELDRLIGPVDAIAHFAAHVPQNERASRFDDCFAANVGATVRLLGWAVRNKIGRFIYASSCAVYGPLHSIARAVIDEEHPVNASSYYAATKLCAERLVRTSIVQDGLGATLFRIGYVYGLGLSRERLVHRILRAVADQAPLALTNADQSVMHLVHARDVARAVRRAIKGPDGVFNLVHEEQPTLREFFHAAEAALGRPGTLNNTEVKDRRDPKIDARRLKERSGWSPEVSLVDGLAEIYREEYVH